MRIVIIGAGFAGLAVCWNLLRQFPKAKIEVIDQRDIGEGTSGMAAGLLHIYAGAHSKLNWNGHEAFEATEELLKVSSDALGSAVSTNTPILRLAMDEQQEFDYQACANKYSDVVWCNPEECRKFIPFIVPGKPGLLIKKARVVNSHFYLEGLWKSCYLKGARFFKRAVENLSDLNDYDLIVVASGASTKIFPELSDLPIKSLKGQLLEFEWPESIPPLSLPLNSYVYLIMTSKNRCIAGATFERDFTNLEPDLTSASSQIMSKVVEMIPALKNCHILQCKAGVRATTPNRLPLLGNISERIWYYTGLGSKGLLYHALFARMLSDKIGAG